VTSYFAEGRQPPPGTLVDQRTYAPFHQHFIVARLDLDVDGPGNTVFACDSEALPVSADNPYGLALVVRETPLRTEAAGRQDYDWQAQRAWKVASSQARNGLGTPTAYQLVPGGCFPAQLDPSSPALRRAEVIGHQLWVTPYRPGERRVSQSQRRRQRAPGLDRARPADRRHGRRPVARVRPESHHPAGGLAGHAVRPHVILAQAMGIL
jgi:primary-amine oxidase